MTIVPACPTAGTQYQFSVATSGFNWPGGTQTIGTGTCALVVTNPKGPDGSPASITPWIVTAPANMSCTLLVADPGGVIGDPGIASDNKPYCNSTGVSYAGVYDYAYVTCKLK